MVYFYINISEILPGDRSIFRGITEQLTIHSTMITRTEFQGGFGGFPGGTVIPIFLEVGRTSGFLEGSIGRQFYSGINIKYCVCHMIQTLVTW